MKKVYLDWAASAPVKKDVQKLVCDFLTHDIGNPSSIHEFGRNERKIIDDAKLAIANWLNIEPREVYFTSGATESINWVIQGFGATVKDSFFISTPAEHKATLAALEFCQWMGAKIELLPVYKFGRIDISHLDQLLAKHPNTLVSIIYANNETGNIENISEIGLLINKKYPQARLHIDATQALGWLDCSQNNLHFHYLTGSGHKLGALKGIGFLIMKKGYELSGLIHGGGQEFDLRGGTENVAGILSLGLVAKNYSENQKQHVERLNKLIMEKIKKIPFASFNTDLQNSTKHILNISFSEVNAEALTMRLDMLGYAVSTGAACSSGAINASHVLIAMGLDEKQAKESIRISFGHDTKENEIKQFLDVLIKEVDRLRQFPNERV